MSPFINIQTSKFLQHATLQRFCSSHSTIVERIPAKRTTRTSTALEPFEQTTSMKQVLASLTPLVRQLPVSANNTVTDCTFALALHCAIDIALERGECID
jgi:hypothetical protein